MSVSKRAVEVSSKEHFLTKYYAICPWQPSPSGQNPQGLINMGTATNQLMEREVEQRLQKPDAFHFSARDHQHYFNFTGTGKLKTALVNFLGRHFSSGVQLEPDNLVVVNGVTACFDILGSGLFDAGETLITPTPVYGMVFDDFNDRPLVDVQPLHLRAEDKFALTGEMLDLRVKELTKQGKKVKAFILLNPQNPLGRNYDAETVYSLLQVGAKHGLHMIIDEIYALSQHREGTSFKSVLSFRDLPDPDRTHVLWGPSKDFGLAGFRLGVLHTTNAALLKYVNTVCFYACCPSVVHDTLATLLNDTVWCDSFFLPTNRQRLQSSYRTAVTRLQEFGIEVLEAEAALFVFANLSPYISEKSKKGEIELFLALFAEGVYVVPGSELYCEDPGWFRFVISVDADTLKIGLDRILQVLQRRKLQTVSIKD